MSLTNPNSVVQVARVAVEKAAIVTRHVQSQLGRLRAMTKDDRSPVTIADFASQAVVARELSARLGAIVLVAEESAALLRQREHAAHLRATISALRDSGAWPEAHFGSITRRATNALTHSLS